MKSQQPGACLIPERAVLIFSKILLNLNTRHFFCTLNQKKKNCVKTVFIP